MRNKYIYSLVMLMTIGVILFATTMWIVSKETTPNEKNEVTVVTSFYPMYLVAENLLDGIEGVHLENLSEPQTGCLHDFQLTPEDMKLLSTADVFIVNGSGAESFLEDVYKEYDDLKVVDATADLSLEEELLMHGWMMPKVYRQEILKIADVLCELYPSFEGKLVENKERYLFSLENLENQYRELSETLKNKPVILFSEAFEGFAQGLGLEVTYLMDLDEERQISSGEVAQVLQAIEKHPGCVIIAEERYGKKMTQLVRAQKEVPVYFLEPITRGTYEKDAYISMMQENLNRMKEMVTQ